MKYNTFSLIQTQIDKIQMAIDAYFFDFIDI